MLNVGDRIRVENANWSFANGVAETFDAHAEKSIPFYHEGHQLVAELSDFFVGNGSLCYDIGCSTGKLTQILAERNHSKNARIIGIDTEDEMLGKARERCGQMPNITLAKGDILEIDLEPADMVYMYYTMQFIRPKFRQLVFDKIFNALNWGGAFVLFEKVRAPDARFQDLNTAVYTDFKIRQGFGSEEIVGKTRSLKGVLEPFSTQGNIDLFKRAGFVDIMTTFKYMCFEGFLAIK